MPTKQIEIVAFFLSDETLVIFAGITLEVEGVVVIIMFVAHAQTDVGVVEGLAYFQRNNVPGLINVAVRWRNLARCLIGGQTRQIGITPDGRILSPCLNSCE